MQALIKFIAWLLGLLKKKAPAAAVSKKVSVPEKMVNLIVKHGGEYRKGKPFLFGVRNDSKIDRFNDVVGVIYETPEGLLKCFQCNGTTDPGAPWVQNPWPGQPGAAMLCLGVYNDVWQIGKRGGKFAQLFGKTKVEVLRQDGSTVRVARDIDKDGKIDVDEPVISGNFEIQFHPMSTTDRASEHKKVGRWSAGCQGPARLTDWLFILQVLKNYDKEHGRQRYGYALFDVSQEGLPAEVKSQAVM